MWSTGRPAFGLRLPCATVSSVPRTGSMLNAAMQNGDGTHGMVYLSDRTHVVRELNCISTACVRATWVNLQNGETSARGRVSNREADRGQLSGGIPAGLHDARFLGGRGPSPWMGSTPRDRLVIGRPVIQSRTCELG